MHSSPLTFIFFGINFSSCTLQQRQLVPSHRRDSAAAVGLPDGTGGTSVPAQTPGSGRVQEKKGRGIRLPAVAERTSKRDGTASKPDSCHAAKCSAALTALEQSLEKLEVAGLGFVFLISSQSSSTELFKRSMAKLESPEDIIYLFLQILQ